MIQYPQLNKTPAAGATNTHYRLTPQRKVGFVMSLPAIVVPAVPQVNPPAFIPHDRVRAVSADIFFGMTGVVSSVHEAGGKQFVYVTLDDPSYAGDLLYFRPDELEGSAERKGASR
jgi:hypothetical protein